MMFRSSSLLWLLAAVPLVLLFLVARERLRTRIAARFVSTRLRGVTRPVRVIRPWLAAAGLLCGVVALAGPYAGFRLVPIVTREANRVLVIDVSNSMGAADVGTSRLSAAKAIAMRLASAHQGRLALVVFEAQPEVASPLTSDTEAVAALIDTIQPGELGQPGSDIGSAVLAALRLTEGDPAQQGDVVVISDGEDQGARVSEAVQRAKSRGAKISTIMIGSPGGSTIPVEGGSLRDSNGDVVTTYARSEALREIAAATGGKALENPFGARALDALLDTTSTGRPRETHARVPLDRYQWPLALGFLLMFLGSLVNRGAE